MTTASRSSVPYLLVVLAILVVPFSIPLSLSGQTDDKKPASSPKGEAHPAIKQRPGLRVFMRQKLEASQMVLEGLVTEDFDLIGKGARQLKKLSEGADFQVSRDPIYAQHSDEFKGVVNRLIRNADQKRLDAAGLSYVDMTMSCIECHRFVKNILVAGDPVK